MEKVYKPTKEQVTEINKLVQELGALGMDELGLKQDIFTLEELTDTEGVLQDVLGTVAVAYCGDIPTDDEVIRTLICILKADKELYAIEEAARGK